MNQYFKHAKNEFKSLKNPRDHSDLNATSIKIIGGGLTSTSQLYTKIGNYKLEAIHREKVT